MGRGRRPNMALEPTRALQTQRAFRQRKADHLANLEESIKTLSEENAKLRKLLHLESASSSLVADVKGSASPSVASTAPQTSSPYVSIAPAKGAPTPSSSSDSPAAAAATCDNCGPIQQANRQLALAASQVEAQMADLQQSIKALRSVLMHHGIPIPSPMAGYAAEVGSVDEAALHRAKRYRTSESAMHQQADQMASYPSGVQMTPSYFNSSAASAAGPSSASSVTAAHEQYAASRRIPSTASAMAASGAWHSPSPSAVLSAPSPPATAFSPRHAYSSYNSPSATMTYPAPPTLDEGYRRPPARQNSGNSSGGGGGGSARSHLPGPSSMSPARQNAHLPQWPLPSTAAAGTRPHALPAPGHSYRSSSHSSVPGMDADGGYVRTYSQRRPDDHGASNYATAGASPNHSYPSQYPTSSSSPYANGSVHSPRARLAHSPRDSGRFGEEAYADRSIPQAAPAKNSPTCAPAKKSCCPPRNDANQATERKIACSTNATDDKPVAATAAAASEPKEDDCCYGFVQCDVDGDKPAPALQAVSTAKETDLDGLKLKEDECCFGLVKCDAEGRIIM